MNARSAFPFQSRSSAVSTHRRTSAESSSREGSFRVPNAQRRGGARAAMSADGTPRLRCRGGFTLVEFLVASLLAVILMATLTGLLNAIWRQSKAAHRAASDYPATWLLEEQIRRDLANARYFELVPRGVRLGGFLTTGSPSGEPTFRHATVSYEVVSSSSNSRLVRVEQPMGSAVSPPRVELLWVGASAVNLIPLVEPLQSERTRVSTKYRDMAALPQDLLFVVREGRGGVVCSARITSHRGI